ncbi:MAG TPA: hypothetical protein VJI15_01580 [Candidatus Nanoarchaeia archaeon]|nr:hypothetical protein [Candidatus Nanoarchaeia archaeon]
MKKSVVREKTIVVSFISVLISLIVLPLFAFPSVFAESGGDGSGDIGIENNLATLTIVSTTPNPIYEFNDVTISVRVESDGSSGHPIKKVELGGDSFTFISANNPASGDWSHSLNPLQITWESSGSGISSGGSQLFKLNLSVLELTESINGSFKLITTDTNNDTSVTFTNITLLNDNIAPRYSNLLPQNQTFVKNGTTDVSVTITEAESGFRQAEMYFDYYTTISESTVTNNDLLSCVGSECTTTVNLQRPEAGKKYVGIFYNFSDIADNKNVTPYFWLYVDDASPSVALGTNPVNNLKTNQGTLDFEFSFDDNSLEAADVGFNPQVSCSITIDGVPYSTTTYDESDGNNAPQTLAATYALADGEHQWQANCTDSAGWEKSTAARTFTVDTTGPVITLNSPEDAAVVAEETLINFTIEDTFGTVNEVWYDWEDEDGNTDLIDIAGPEYTISPLTDGWSYGENYITVHATDNFDNEATATYTFTIDNVGPEVTLLSPDNGGIGNGDYIFQANDDYSLDAGDLSCILNFVDVGQAGEVNTESGVETTITNITEGSFDWNVTCTDEFGNSGTSVQRTVTIDSTPPVVTLTTPSAGQNMAGLEWAFEYDQTDDNEDVDGCTVHAYDSSRVEVGDSSADVAAANTPYTWNVSCTDTAGNMGWSTTVSFYNDNIKPVISEVLNSSIDSSSATISWKTNEVSNHTVYYGIDAANLTSSLQNLTSTSTPTLLLSGLSASTTYSYVIQSCDKWNNCKNDTTIYSFTTTSAPASSSSGGGGGGGGGDSCSRGYERVNGVCTLIPEVVEEVSSCEPLWRCTEWGQCTDGQQSRTCEDWSLCGVSDGKPEESQQCEGAGSASDNGIDTADVSDAAADGLTGQANPLGVGQATGIFSAIQSNWKPLAGSLAVLSLLGLMFWQRGPLSTAVRKVANFKQARMHKQEEQVRQKLRKEGLIK